MPTVAEHTTRLAPSGSRALRAVLTALFFVSGAVGLAYEVAWTRALLRMLGGTPAGTAIVLGVFVGALGLGARWAGARADGCARPLRSYGLLELGAAAWALLFLPLLGAFEGPYVALASGLGEGLRHGLRLLFAVGLVLPGAWLLGATLPYMLVAWRAPPAFAGRAVPWLYGINALGAVFGAWTTGFLLLEAWGVRGVLWAVAGTGALVGCVGLLVARRSPAHAAAARSPTPGTGFVRAGLIAAFTCGFLGMGLQALGFRLLVFFVEGFTTSLAAVVGTFILGLGLGSLLLGRWAARTKDPARALVELGVMYALWVGLAWTLLLPRLEPWLGAVRAWAYGGASSPEGLEAGHRWVALAGGGLLFLVPTFLLGPSFTLCVRWAAQGGASAARSVGAVYLANSLGSVLGPAVLALVLVPRVGVGFSWGLLALLALAAVGVAFQRLARPRGRVAWLGLVGCLVLLPLISLGDLLTVGVRFDDATLVRVSHVLARRPDRRLLEARSDSVTTVSVIQTPDGERILYTDDFAAAATGPQYRYMRLLGHLPALLAQRTENALVIAFGTGTTAGALARHPGVKRLEVAELSPAVIAMAPHFDEVHGGVLSDARTRLLVDDGREALLLHAPDLDVITLEPLMPYSPAGLPFYTREFYEMARDRLREGGVLCQWVPVHAMRVGLYEALLRTFYEVFPDGTLWFFEQSTALIARKGGAGPSAAEAQARFLAAGAQLAEAGYPSLELLASACVADGRTVLGRPGQEAGFSERRVTDLDPWPEFHATPRGVMTSYLTDALAYLATLAVESNPPAPWGGEAVGWGRLQQGAESALRARTLDARAQHLGLLGTTRTSERVGLLDEAAAAYARALERLPGEQALTWRRARALRESAEVRVRSLLMQAQDAEQANRVGEAQDLRRAALGIAKAALSIADGVAAWSRRGSAAITEALASLSLGRCAAAEQVLVAAAAALGATPQAREVTALLEAVRARTQGASGSPALTAWSLRYPPCRGEGLEPVATLFAAWSQARAQGAATRVVRLAAKNLVVAATSEGVEPAVLAALRTLPEEGGAVARAQRAVLLRLLDGQDASLSGLLEASVTDDAAAGELASAALAEAGAHNLVRRLPPELLARLRAASDPRLRTALLRALAEDGEAALLPHAVALLDDSERVVRVAAAAAALPHDPQGLRDYDPDQPGSWGRVQKRLTR